MASPLNASGELQANNVGTSSTFNAGFTFTAGRDAIFSATHYQGTAGLITSVTIGGTAATRDLRIGADANNRCEIWRATNIAGGTTDVVVNYSTASDNYITASCEEWAAGMFPALSFSNTNNGTSTTPNGSFITDIANVVLYSAFNNASVDLASLTEPSGYTVGFEELLVTGVEGGGAAYFSDSAAGSKTATWTANTSIVWSHAFAGYAFGPLITVQPSNQTVFQNATATFTLTATSPLTLSYQWYFDGSPVGTDSNSYARTNCALADNNKNVYCEVTDANGTTTSITVKLFVTTTGSIYYLKA